jgi:Mannosyltransferase (PIG-V)
MTVSCHIWQQIRMPVNIVPWFVPSLSSLSQAPMPSAVVAPSTRVLYYALLSRILLLSLIATWRLIFRPYDTSASFNPPCLSSSLNQSQPFDQILWPRVASAIESSVVWDSVFFVRIAECGYEYEQFYAFLPLLPIAMSLLSRSGKWSMLTF